VLEFDAWDAGWRAALRAVRSNATRKHKHPKVNVVFVFLGCATPLTPASPASREPAA